MDRPVIRETSVACRDCLARGFAVRRTSRDFAARSLSVRNGPRPMGQLADGDLPCWPALLPVLCLPVEALCANESTEGREQFLVELGEKTDKQGLVALLVKVQLAGEQAKEREKQAQAARPPALCRGRSHRAAWLVGLASLASQCANARGSWTSAVHRALVWGPSGRWFSAGAPEEEVSSGAWHAQKGRGHSLGQTVR